jgi:hypothetical protein
MSELKIIVTEHRLSDEPTKGDHRDCGSGSHCNR